MHALSGSRNCWRRFFSYWGKAIYQRFLETSTKKKRSKKTKKKRSQSTKQNRSFGWGQAAMMGWRWILKPSTSNGKNQYFFMLHLRSQSSAPGGVLSSWVQSSPSSWWVLRRRVAEPQYEKNRNAQYEKKSFDKSFRTISKNALPQIVKKSFPAISRTTKYMYNQASIFSRLKRILF